MAYCLKIKKCLVLHIIFNETSTYSLSQNTRLFLIYSGNNQAFFFFNISKRSINFQNCKYIYEKSVFKFERNYVQSIVYRDDLSP